LPLCMDNESFRSRADIVKGIASYESQAGFICQGDDASIARCRDLNPIDLEPGYPGSRLKKNLVISVNVFQAAEECIPVAGNSNASRLAGERRSLDVPRP